MINLFNVPNHVIDTSNFGNHLHGSVVTEFENQFCEYVGAKYACSLNSATNAIFLAMERERPQAVSIPSVLPPVVFNALYHARVPVEYRDDTGWVGGSYELHDFGDYKIIDSAQRVDRNQFHEADDQDLMIFSFYPTKPVGGMDGGIIVSNDKDKIDYFRQRSLNGMVFSENNWEREQVSIGWKMYMNSVDNTSDHLYRINVSNRDDVISRLKTKGIVTGIHYAPLHLQPLYERKVSLPNSEEDGRTTLSIPFNECLYEDQLARVVDAVRNEL